MIVEMKIIFFETGSLFACLFYLYNSLQIPVGRLSYPGPGFFPIILGVVGAIISMVLVVNSFSKQKKVGKNQKNASKGEEMEGSFGRILGCIIGLGFFAVTFEAIGSLAGIFIIVLVLSKICGLRGWLSPLLLGLGSSLFIYVVFALWFKIPLPAGLLNMLL